MFKKTISHILASALLLSFVGVPTVSAKSKAEKAAEFAAKVKDGIAKLGTGPEARLEIRLRDKTKLKGYVSKIGDTSFSITDAKTGVETDVPYPAVAQANGKNMSTGAIVTLSILAGVGILLVILLVAAAAGS